MTTTYQDNEYVYSFQATNGPTIGGLLSLKVSDFGGSSGGWTEADLDTAVRAFTDSLNTSALVRIDLVTKYVEANALSDWKYETPP